MTQMATHEDFSRFDDLRHAFRHQRLAFFLDVDGTLVDIAQRPDAVRVTPPLREVLHALSERNRGAVALVSGRSLEDLDRLFAPLAITAAGLHGVERRDARGTIHARDHRADLDGVRQYLSECADSDLLVEDKGSALVVHFREQPALAEHARDVAERALAHGHGAWRVVEGKMSYEIRLSGVGKSDAIQAFLAEPPFASRVPAFFGDDVTDEDGFETVNRLGGWSVLVGPDRPTLARLRLPDPDSVCRLLWNLLAASEPVHARPLSPEEPAP
jgi:trehalose 6-phosphate phosphatase